MPPLQIFVVETAVLHPRSTKISGQPRSYQKYCQQGDSSNWLRWTRRQNQSSRCSLVTSISRNFAHGIAVDLRGLVCTQRMAALAAVMPTTQESWLLLRPLIFTLTSQTTSAVSTIATSRLALSFVCLPACLPAYLSYRSMIHLHCAGLDQLGPWRGGAERCALIVAGDVCTSLSKMRAAFGKLTSLYTYVFYVPGNHELWTAKNEANSVQKFLDILRLCDECGVHTRPAWVAPGVAIVPLFSWYKTDLFPGMASERLSSKEQYADLSMLLFAVMTPHGLPQLAYCCCTGSRYFDCACFWPPGVGTDDDPHLSTHSGVADFFLRCNESRFERSDWCVLNNCILYCTVNLFAGV
jgi:hypothetical protein